MGRRGPLCLLLNTYRVATMTVKARTTATHCIAMDQELADHPQSATPFFGVPATATLAMVATAKYARKSLLVVRMKRQRGEQCRWVCPEKRAVDVAAEESVRLWKQ